MKVALAEGDDRLQNISRALHRLIDKVDIPKFQTVLIKPNLTGADGIYCNTSKEAAKAVVDFLNVHFNPQKIFVGEGSGGAYASGWSTMQILKNMGYEELTEISNVELMNIDELEHKDTFQVETYDGKQILYFARPQTDLMISLALPKTHDLAVATLGLKNMMGLIFPDDRKKIHGYNDVDGMDGRRLFRDDIFYLQCVEKIHKNLQAFFSVIKPDMTVLDGYQGMEGDGPVGGEPLFHGYALASLDPIAADFVGARLMGLDPMSIGYLYYLTEDFVPGWAPEIFGEDLEPLIRRYKLHRKYQLQQQWLPQ
jgi:uncharacterized protein (DUF362 family)